MAGIAQGASLAAVAVCGRAALEVEVIAAKGGAMSVSQAAGMGAGGEAGTGRSGEGQVLAVQEPPTHPRGGSAPKPTLGGD